MFYKSLAIQKIVGYVA